MKIAIDTRELCGKPTGVGRYLFQLLEQWAGSPERHRHEWLLYAHATPVTPENLADCVRLIPGGGGTRWEQWEFARRLADDKPDVLFAPAYTAPLSAPCPIVLTIHDMSFFARPREFRWREGVRRRRLTAWAARRARVIVTVSEFSRQEIAKHTGVPLASVRVIYHGSDEGAAPDGGHIFNTVRDAVPRDPLILYVGSIFPRRHVDVLVSAFAQFVALHVSDARLEIVGDVRLPPGSRHPGEWLRELAPSVRDRVAFRSWVDDRTLRDLYARASAFAFLSDYEGFGLTPLEALAAGVPPVVLDTPVAREIYSAAARYILWPAAPTAIRGQTPSNELRTVESAVGETLVELLTSPAAREAVLRQAPEVLARYRWDRAAKLTFAALTEAAGV